MCYVHYRTGREPFQYEKMNAEPCDPDSRQTRAKRAVKRDIDGLFKYSPQIFKVPTHKQILRSCLAVKERPMFEDTVVVTLDDIMKHLPPDTPTTVAIKKFAQAYLTDEDPPALSLYFGQFIQRSAFTDAFERRHPKNAGASSKEESSRKKMKVTTAYNNNEAIFIRDTYDGKILLLRKKIISSQCLMSGCFRQKMHAWHPYGRFDSIPAEDDQYFIHAFSQNSRPSLTIDRALVSSKTPHICPCNDLDPQTMKALQSIYKDKPLHVGSTWRLIINLENPGDGVMVRMAPEAAGGHAKALKLRKHGILPPSLSKPWAVAPPAAVTNRTGALLPSTPPALQRFGASPPLIPPTAPPKRHAVLPPPTPPGAPGPQRYPALAPPTPPVALSKRYAVLPPPTPPAALSKPPPALSKRYMAVPRPTPPVALPKAPEVVPAVMNSLDDLFAAAEATGDLKAAGLIDNEPTPPAASPPPLKKMKTEPAASPQMSGSDELANYFASLNQKLYAELQTLNGVPTPPVPQPLFPAISTPFPPVTAPFPQAQVNLSS